MKRKRPNGTDMPTMGLTALEVWQTWTGLREFEIHANFTGQVVGYSAHKPSVEYSFDGMTRKLQRCWRTEGGIAVAEDATETEIDNIFQELEAGTFQIVYASPKGVDASYSRYVPKRQAVILHQSDGRKLKEHRKLQCQST
jgi:hypothetical protein